MEPETRYTLVGSTVLALVIAAIFAIVWLSGSGASRDSRFYTIVFQRQSLEGLQVGGDVNMRGVKVGRVELFTIARDNINRVEVKIRVDSRTPVSENTRAVVARNLLTGIARINLETPGTPGPELTRVAAGEAHPVIPEGDSGLERIAESANRLAVSGEQALSNLNMLLTPENQKAFGETLAGVRDLAVGLGSRLSALDAALAGVTDSARAFQVSSQRIASAVEGANVQIGPLSRQAERLLTDSTAAVGQSQATLREFASAARAVERQAEFLGRRADDATDAGLLELRASAQELRRTAELLSHAVERLAEPRSALIGPSVRELGPGERNQ